MQFIVKHDHENHESIHGFAPFWNRFGLCPYSFMMMLIISLGPVPINQSLLSTGILQYTIMSCHVMSGRFGGWRWWF